MKTKFIFTSLLLGLITTSSFSQKIVWKPKAEIPYKIYSGSAVTCQDEIYFIGGQKDIGSGNYMSSNMIFEYDLAMDEWIEKPSMPTARFNMAIASVDGKIYAIGGDRLLDKNEMYDPSTETWHTLAPMPTARQHIKAAVVDNKIYIIGGLDDNYVTVSTRNEVYDPQTNTWQQKASIPTPKHNYSTVVYDGKIYICGGSTQNGGDIWVKTSTVQVYDPATNTWDTSSSLPSVRFNPGIGIINDKIIIVGGSSDVVIPRVDFFNPVTDSWSQGNSLPKKNLAMGSTTLNNKIYIIGGTDGPSGWHGYNTVYEGTINESENLIPELYYPLEDESFFVNEKLEWTVPAFTFVDDDTLSYSASLTEGDDLPSWLSFSYTGRKLTGTPEKEDTLNIIIKAVDNYNESVSDTFKLFVKTSITGIDQYSTNKDDLLIFPNPATNYIQVQAKENNSELDSFQILTIDGKVIKEGKLEAERINVSELNKGVFLLNIKTNERIITRKFVIE